MRINIFYQYLYFSTKFVVISNAASGQSIGTKWPALFIILNYKNPADLIDPTTLLLIFHGLNNNFLNY